jgi:hypothetical protein
LNRPERLHHKHRREDKMGTGYLPGRKRGPSGGGVSSYCPRCRELNPLPPYFRIGEKVKCIQCGSEYKISAFTVPSLLPKQQVRGLLGTLVVVVLAGLLFYLLWVRLAKAPEPVATESNFNIVEGNIVYNYTVVNRGGRGLVSLRPRYWTASGQLFDVLSTGSERVEMSSGEVLHRSGKASVGDWPVGFRVECLILSR